MSELKPVTLSFNGSEYKVEKEDNIWGMVEAIEGVITFFELAPALAEGKYPTAKIFRAYAAALNYAGAKVTANEVRSASNYRDMGEMAGALGTILMLTQPGEGIDLGRTEASTQEVESVKKKAAES